MRELLKGKEIAWRRETKIAAWFYCNLKIKHEKNFFFCVARCELCNELLAINLC